MSNRFLKNTAYGSIAGGTTTLCNFAMSLIIARELGLQATGYATFALWVATTATTFFSLGIPFTLSRFLPDVAARTDVPAATGLAAYWMRRFFLIALIPATVGGSYAILAFVTKLNLFGSATSPDYIIALVVGLSSSVLAVSEFAKAFSRGIFRFDQVAKASIVSAVVQILVTFILIRLGGDVIGVLVGYTIGAAVFLPLLRPLYRSELHASRPELSRMKRYAFFRWGAELLALFVWSRIEVLFLQSYWGAAPVALFQTALTLSSLAVQAPLLLTWGLMPHFAERIALADHENTQRTYAMATRLLAALILPACFGLAAISDGLIPLLFGREFASAVGPAQMLVIASAYPAIASVGSAVILATDRSDVEFYTCLFGTIVSIAIGLPLTEHFGLPGAVSSRIVVQAIVTLLATAFILRHLRLRLPLVAISKLTGASTFCAAAAWCTLKVTYPAIGVLGIGCSVLVGICAYLVCLRYISVFEPNELKLLQAQLQRLLRPVPWLATRLN